MCLGIRLPLQEAGADPVQTKLSQRAGQVHRDRLADNVRFVGNCVEKLLRECLRMDFRKH